MGHLAVAFALTYALGFEREVRGAEAGVRIFALIGVGGGVLGIIALHGASTALSGAVTGIGFIGGGLVFRQAIGRREMIRGLTTAAALFAGVGIGAAAGLGRLLVASVATAVTVFTLEIRHVRLLDMLDPRRWAGRFRDDEAPVRSRRDLGTGHRASDDDTR